MTNYRGGADFERRVAARLTRDGYRLIRAAGSKGVVDMLAGKPGQRLAVQAKWSSSGTARVPGPAERRDLVLAARDFDALPVLAMNVRRRSTLWLITDDGTSPKAIEPFFTDFTQEA